MSIPERINRLLSEGRDVGIQVSGVYGVLLARENDVQVRTGDDQRFRFHWTLKPHSAGKRGRSRYAISSEHLKDRGKLVIAFDQTQGRHVVRHRSRPVRTRFNAVHLSLLVAHAGTSHSALFTSMPQAFQDLVKGGILDPQGALTKRGRRVVQRLVTQLQRAT